MDDLTLFRLRAIRHPSRVGTTLPTPDECAGALLDLAGDAAWWRSRQLVAEIGPGPGGPFTSQLLARLGADAELLAFEIDPVFAARLRQRLADPRLRVITASGEQAGSWLGGRKADAVLACLPLKAMGEKALPVLRAARGILAGDAPYLAAQYGIAVTPLLQAVFGDVRVTVEMTRTPTMALFTCREAVTVAAAPPA